MSPPSRPRVIYVSYDGAGEPLGRSQVLAYLRRLARDCDITLISFEKDRTSRPETAQLLHEAGIRWLPLSYHRRPPVLSTLWDVAVGALTLRRASRSFRPDIVHVRSYVPALIGLVSALPGRRPWKFLFDIRAFWADERVAGGIWPAEGRLYRVAKRCERWFFGEADAVVTLAAASLPQIKRWLGNRVVPVVVIPTCAEVARFEGKDLRPGGPHTVWCGSLGTFYRFDLAVRLAGALELPFTVLTRQTEAARAQIGAGEVDIREVSPSDVPDELYPGDVGLCLITHGFPNLARAPTRFAEYLAAGMPVAVTRGVGDLDAITVEHKVGVLIDDESDTSLARAAAEIFELARDPRFPERARRVASRLYSVDSGAAAYLELYRSLAQPSSS